jgi:membrane-bound lytic murein transglycosylase
MVVATAGHITGLPATNHLRKILMTREQNLYVFMQTTTSVVTRIDDNAFLQVVFAQDIGSAIKGVVRGDYFWGHCEEALKYAGRMNSVGKYYLLVPKETVLKAE